MTKNKIIHDGYSDGFIPLQSLDINKCHTVNDLVRAMDKTAFGGRTVGEAADVLYEMINDPDCFVVGTFSGAMTVAKMGLLISEMIDHNIIQAVVSTGALMTHGMVEGYGMNHFKYKLDSLPDEELLKRKYDRIYDTLELEKNLDDLERMVFKVFSKFNLDETLSSYKILQAVGKHLNQHSQGRSILKSAYLQNVPVYNPAFTDSEFGLDFGLFNRWQTIKKLKQLQFNPFLDLEHFTELILKQKNMGIFTIGGGVPRNWAQQVGPYIDLINWSIANKLNSNKYFSSDKDTHRKAYKYGVRICPEPVHWGGLSGCTYSEGTSWGKFISPNKGGKFAEVLCDATIAWPIILKAVLERLGKKKIKKNFKKVI